MTRQTFHTSLLPLSLICFLIGALLLGCALTAGAQELSTPHTPDAQLHALETAFVGLQAADLITTRVAIANGAHEANPVLGGCANHMACLLSVKAGISVWTVMAAEKAAKEGHRKAAKVILLIDNSLFGLVVGHNFSVIATLRR